MMMTPAFLGALACALVCSSVATISEDFNLLYKEFDSASQEILDQIHSQEPLEQLEKTDAEELVTHDNPQTQMLLDEAAHKKAVKASYQTNVKTIYFHLEEIIKKILAHKTKWTNKYNGDLAKIAKEVLKHKNIAKNKEKKYTAAKGKAEAAKALAKTKNKSWQKAKNKLKQKINDAKKQKKALKGLYLKGLRQKAGEICMIRKIECMVAKFNGEAALQAKYCAACTDDTKAKTVQTWVDSAGKAVKPAAGPAAGKPTKLTGTATQSSTGWSGPASKGIDGNTNTQYSGGSCTHTYNKPKEWWKLAFGKTRTVTKVKVWNRSDCCNGRLAGATVVVGGKTLGTLGAAKGEQTVNGKATGTSLQINNKPGEYLTLCEVKVFGY